MIGGQWRTWATIVLGATISGIFLWLAVRQIDGQEVFAALVSADYVYVLVSALAVAGGLALRATRWRLIASAPSASQATYYRAANLGALSNMILPARAGEFVRIVTLAKLRGMRLLNPVVSSLLDRLVDVVVLLIAAAGLYLFLPRDTTIDNWLGTIVIAAAGVIGGAIVLGVVMGRGQAWLTWLTERWLQNWRLRPDIFLAELRHETHDLLSGWLSLRLICVILLICFVDCAAIIGLLLAFHLNLPLIATVLLWVFLTIGSMLPSAPGYIGVYQTAAIWALSVFAVPPSSAVAVAIVLQAATLVVTLLVTGPSFLRLLKSALAAGRAEGL